MSLWTAAVVIVAIWAFVQIWTRRNDRDLGVTRDEDGNPVFAPPRDDEADATRREIEQLRDRLHVLERIATDGNNPDARERARIAAEIEALRAPEEGSVAAQSVSGTSQSSEKEQSK
ncbi:hypothetical protein [Erythrobacter sp.]|jgi:hypothetical protein|uniref:hypothetical protein n=1 Tax=Erythrobacter sp. TaxID=1042 RepID=UPI002EB7308E|nr:hypothetical protein [Erythrobacter sp.]